MSSKSFLKAQWRKLIMVNYSVDPSVLEPYLPRYTELDFWEGKCIVSLVGFMFLDTKLKGIKIPFHTNFEEVNLRFYVHHKENEEWKRGVVFIKEIVPRRALTFVANTVYKEKYETLRMKHEWKLNEEGFSIQYQWLKKGKWNSLSVKTDCMEKEIESGSEEEFITEHFWGYTKLSEYKTSEYEVQHPRWKIYSLAEYSIDVDFGEVYGKQFSFMSELKPISVFTAEGSDIEVKSGKKLRTI